MKRIVITGDKKTIWLLALHALLVMASIYYMSLDFKPAFAKYGRDINTMPFFIAGVIIEIVIYALVMNQLVTIINLKDGKMGFGIFNLGRIEYSEIKKIHVGNKLELHTDNKVKYIKILSFDNNKEKYMSLLKFLDEKIDKRIKPESIFGSLTQYENTKFKTNKGVKLKIGGLLIIPAIYLVWGPITNITMVLRPSDTGNSVISTVYYGVMAILAIVAAIYFFGRKPAAVNLLKIYSICFAFGGAILNFTSLLIEGGQVTALTFTGSVTGIVFILIAYRYLNISKRVKATFAK